MTRVLDSSAIIVVLKRLKERSVGVLEGKVTLDLACYELGNVIWKEYALKSLIGVEEAIKRAGQIAKILEVVRLERITSNEDFRNAMKLAAELKLTFYDASYLQLSKKTGVPLVTEDEELRERAAQAGVKATKMGELLEQT